MLLECLKIKLAHLSLNKVNVELMLVELSMTPAAVLIHMRISIKFLLELNGYINPKTDIEYCRSTSYTVHILNS